MKFDLRSSIHHQLAPVAAASLIVMTLAGCGGGGGGLPAQEANVAVADAAASGPAVTDAALSVPEPDETEVEAPKIASADAKSDPGAVAIENDTDAPATAEAIGLFTSEAAPAASTGTTDLPMLVISARADMLDNVGAIMAVRLNAVEVARVEVRSKGYEPYSLPLAGLKKGDKLDIVFTNDGAGASGGDRNLFLSTLTYGSQTVLPSMWGGKYDRGVNAAAFDGKDVVAGQSEMVWDGALRLTWPGATVVDPLAAKKYAAVRFLQKATFGPNSRDLMGLVNAKSYGAWLDLQMAKPATTDFVRYISAQYKRGDNYRPNGGFYDANWNVQTFWRTAFNAQDSVRQRVAFALHQTFVVSMADANVAPHARAYANYLDLLHKHAFGNYRELLEEIALSPVMGLYLSHLGNQKEDPTNGQLPDENFAREVMQLFSIGLNELNQDGTLKLGANGKPIETYGNADVMGLAKVFTGFSWGFPDAELTEENFANGAPDYSVARDKLIDLNRMKPYPGQTSTSEKRFFIGKPNETTIAAGASATDGLKKALDALYSHPNVGPFVGKQLIQKLVKSNPSPAYVGRVAAVFNNDGSGVRGNLKAVIKAILLDDEALSSSKDGYLKLRDPVTKMALWGRAFGVRSMSSAYMVSSVLDGVSQKPLFPPSVFSYYRPTYSPAGTRMNKNGLVAPEFQLANESTTAAWIGLAAGMAGTGLGWYRKSPELYSPMGTQVAFARAGDVSGLVQSINGMIFAGNASPKLLDAMTRSVVTVGGSTPTSNLNRARAAAFIALSSPEFAVQR